MEFPLPILSYQNTNVGGGGRRSHFPNKASLHVGGQWCLPKTDLWLKRKFLFPKRWISLPLITEISCTVWCCNNNNNKKRLLIYPWPIQTRAREDYMFSVTLSSAEARGCINIENENGENTRFTSCPGKVDPVLCLYSLSTMDSNEDPKCDSSGMQRSFLSPPHPQR